MPFSAKQTKLALLKKGFTLSEGDHHFYTFYHNGKMVSRTRMSHNNQEIHDGLIGKMSRQCQLKKGQFLDLINCSLDQKGYIEILEKTGIIVKEEV